MKQARWEGRRNPEIESKDIHALRSGVMSFLRAACRKLMDGSSAAGGSLRMVVVRLKQTAAGKQALQFKPGQPQAHHLQVKEAQRINRRFSTDTYKSGKLRFFLRLLKNYQFSVLGFMLGRLPFTRKKCHSCKTASVSCFVSLSLELREKAADRSCIRSMRKF